MRVIGGKLYLNRGVILYMVLNLRILIVLRFFGGELILNCFLYCFSEDLVMRVFKKLLVWVIGC